MVTLSCEFLLVFFFFLACEVAGKSFLGKPESGQNCFFLSRGGQRVYLFCFSK